MSEQKEESPLKTSLTRKKKDSSILKKIEELYSSLSCDGKDVLFWSMVNKESYKKKRNWSPKENMILRVFFGRVHPDEICEFFECSYASFIDQCQAIGIIDLSEGRPVCAEDMEWFYKLLDSHSAKELCSIVGIDYDKQYDMFMISPEVEFELSKLKDQVGIEGFFDED